MFDKCILNWNYCCMNKDISDKTVRRHTLIRFVVVK